MKRITFALGGLAALIIIGYFGWNALRPSPAVEPDTIALVDGTDTAVSPDTQTPPTESGGQTTEPPAGDLPLLPGLSGSGGGMGMGGGGGVASGEPAPLETDIASDMRIWNPLVDTEYILNAQLPTEPAAAPVYEQISSALTTDDVARFASYLGMTGPIYREIYPVFEPLPVDIPTTDEAPIASEMAVEPPSSYFVFDGPRTLSVYNNSLSYYDMSATAVDGQDLMPFEQAAPLAEAFLQERGLLDFDYQIKTPVWDIRTVDFHRVIDGRMVDTAEYTLTYSQDGQLISLFYNPLNQLQALGDYPLRTAEAAWQLIVEEGIDYQRSYFYTYPGPGFVQPTPQPLPFEQQYRYWSRLYQEGDEIVLYSNPIVYEPVNNDAAPRILADQFVLSGSDDTLRPIAEAVGQQVRFTGIVRGSQPGAQTLEVTNWERIEFIDYQFRTGIIRVRDGQTVLETEEGETIIIPDAPADLADGEKVNVNGWAIETDEAGNLVFNWLGIDIYIDYEAIEPQPIDPALETIEPYRIGQVTIESVDMIYGLSPIFEEGRSETRLLLQPAWRFQGVTDTNEGIVFIVQAVTDEYLAPTPSPLSPVE